ncbi:ATP-binding protein [Streptomyces sp. NPDC050535]|uniref:ATP-binding protein n=1 Tax=Streptomyces sp. NPDC050535 TaxID=3365626 RepID=UPI0037BD834D
MRREHDRLLADAVGEAKAGRSRIVVLVGTSSTGKTRACWEAVQPLAEQGWLLWHPFDLARPGLAWPGLAWPGLAWPGLAWPGLAWPGLAWPGPARPGPARARPKPRWRICTASGREPWCG